MRPHFHSSQLRSLSIEGKFGRPPALLVRLSSAVPQPPSTANVDSISIARVYLRIVYDNAEKILDRPPKLFAPLHHLHSIWRKKSVHP